MGDVGFGACQFFVGEVGEGCLAEALGDVGQIGVLVAELVLAAGLDVGDLAGAP